MDVDDGVDVDVDSAVRVLLAVVVAIASLLQSLGTRIRDIKDNR